MTIFDIKALNDLVRFHLVQDVTYRLSQLAAVSASVIIGKWRSQINFT
jgi:phosphoketolase